MAATRRLECQLPWRWRNPSVSGRNPQLLQQHSWLSSSGRLQSQQLNQLILAQLSQLMLMRRRLVTRSLLRPVTRDPAPGAAWSSLLLASLLWLLRTVWVLSQVLLEREARREHPSAREVRHLQEPGSREQVREVISEVSEALARADLLVKQLPGVRGSARRRACLARKTVSNCLLEIFPTTAVRRSCTSCSRSTGRWWR